jgi:hypothetical protein
MRTSLPTSIHNNAITDASAWQPQDLYPDQTWNVSLTDEQVDDLLSGLNQVKDLHIAEINRANFPPNSIGRMIDASEIGHLAVFLCSDKSWAINGEVIAADDGGSASVYY